MSKKTLAQKLGDFFTLKGYATKEQREGMTAEQFKNLKIDIKAEFGEELEAVLAKANVENELDGQRQSIIQKANALLGKQTQAPTGEGTQAPDGEGTQAPDGEGTQAPAGEGTQAPTGEGTQAPTGESSQKQLLDLVTGLTTALGTAQSTIHNLEGQQAPPKPKKVNAKIVSIVGSGHTDKYMFGIEHPMFDMAKPWNKVGVKGLSLEQLSIAGVTSAKWEDYDADFRKEFKGFAKQVAGRIQHHLENGTLGTLDNKYIETLGAMDFSGFDGTVWGEQYLVRRTDALISYLRMLPNITNVIPVRYGVQDKMVVTNSFFENISGAWQTGKYTKGGVSFEPMLAEVFDVMIKHKFTDMKKLEREYIGYRNREGSFPIKWNMVEWVMSELGRVGLNEQNERRVVGFRVDPTSGVIGHHNLASDGLIRKMTKWQREGLISAESDLNTYTESTILAYVKAFAKKLNNYLPSLKDVYIGINEKHVIWYLDEYQEAYGKNLDYKGAMIDIPNLKIKLKPIPGMENSCFMFASVEDNIEFYELNPGEMFGFYFQQDLDELWAMSTWKEGVGAYRVGKKTGEKKYQWIFVNDPFTLLDADATTADASVNNYFKTQSNTGAKALTDFVGKSEGVLYTLVCGGLTNATTVAKSGLFSEITEAWTPTALGDYLEVYWDETTSKYVEYGRKVTS